MVEEDSAEAEIYVGTNLTIISETQVTVRCEAPVNPAPDIKWQIQGRDTGFKDTVTLSKDNATLTISDTTGRDSGLYSCTASNNVGRDLSSSSINILRKSSCVNFFTYVTIKRKRFLKHLAITICDNVSLKFLVFKQNFNAIFHSHIGLL